MAEHYDIAVLGAGSGGLAAAQRAAGHGAKVALFDPGTIGGTCVHDGCVPKKLTWFAAEVPSFDRHAEGYGFHDRPAGFDWGAFVRTRHAFIAGIEERYHQRLKDAGVTFLPERGVVAGSGHVRAGDRLFSATTILIATGSSAIVPPLDGAELGETSDDFFTWTSLPKRVAIIGGGYISVELAGVLNGLGVEVSIFARASHLLEAFDREAAGFLTERMRRDGISVTVDVNVDRLSGERGNITVHCDATEPCGGFDRVIWAVGRRPNTSDLDESGKLDLDDKSRIIIDDDFATSLEGIYAIGDCTPLRPLTPVAIKAGRHLADRLFGSGSPRPHLDCVPSVVFSHPPVASIGLDEHRARALHGDDVRVLRARFEPMRSAFAGVRAEQFIKLVCVGPDDRIVGLHHVGEGADEIIQGFGVAIGMGACLADLDVTVGVHPTIAEEIVTLR